MICVPAQYIAKLLFVYECVNILPYYICNKILGHSILIYVEGIFLLRFLVSEYYCHALLELCLATTITAWTAVQSDHVTFDWDGKKSRDAGLSTRCQAFLLDVIQGILWILCFVVISFFVSSSGRYFCFSWEWKIRNAFHHRITNGC